MKLLDSILISLATALFIIGVHQTFYYGVAASYWLFMLSLFLFFWLRAVKAKRKEEGATTNRKEITAKKTVKPKNRK